MAGFTFEHGTEQYPHLLVAEGPAISLRVMAMTAATSRYYASAPLIVAQPFVGKAASSTGGAAGRSPTNATISPV
jgi:hypothetical protein